jgi:hypothetical protein
MTDYRAILLGDERELGYVVGRVAQPFDETRLVLAAKGIRYDARDALVVSGRFGADNDGYWPLRQAQGWPFSRASCSALR